MATKKSPETVRVVVRCRPMSRKEVEDSRVKIVQINDKSGEVALRNPEADAREAPKPFTFDQVYDHEIGQEAVFETTAMPIVDSVLQGYNGTVFAYGQTGTGKTHTMEGQWDPPTLRGIIPRAFCHVFECIDATHEQNFLVRASFLEIYNEEVRDLLSKDPKNRLELKESVDSGVYVKDLTSYVVKGVSEMENVLLAGKKNRSVGSTLMNQDSSRSHSIFSIIIESSVEDKDGNKHIKAGKLNLVDLAGSERQSKTGATGDRLKEATKINMSLSALGNVISALVDDKSQHVPYRDSKLTRLLQDSLGGNSYTTLVATVNPREIDAEESLNTLQFANRCRNVQTQPHVNYLDADSASQAKVIDKLMKEIAALKDQLSSQKDHYENRIAGSAPPPKSNTASPEDRGGGTPGAVSVSEAADDAKSRGTSRGSARRGEGKPARSSTADQNALSEAQAISRDLKEKFNKKNMEFRAAQEAARRNEERLKRDIDEYRGKVSTVSEDMQQTVQQLKIGKHEEAQRYEREMDLLKEHNNKLLNDMDNALRSVPERLRVDTSRIKETEARVAGIKEEMHTEMTKDNKKAAEDQTKNLELQRAQYEFWLKKKTDELAVFVEQFDQYKIDKTKQINALENNAIYLFDYSNKLATLIANYEKGNYPVYEKAGIKAIAFPDKDKPDAMMVDTIKEVLKYKKRADDFVRGRPTGLEASFTEETPAANLRGATAASGAGSQAQKGAGGGDADVDALERQLSAARLKLDVAERQVADQGSDSRAKIEQEVLADLADHPTVEYIKRIEDERTYYKELLHEETRRCKDLRVALDAKQRALDKTAQVGQLSAMARSGVGGQRLGNTKVAASASGMAIGSRAT
mmetsp:Transcript_10295/g.22959  ORF Transcript_10295/g.22959 Transcript_10295/m.22959 type:complete len:863 (+) Transcript_10295:48-2636(+)